MLEKTTRALMDFLKDNWYYYSIFKYHTYRRNVLKDEKRIFRNLHSRELELEHPVYFNDHIIKNKLYWRDDLAIKCANKLTVRTYVEDKIGKEYLTPLISVLKHPSELIIEELPSSFAIKMSHGSGMNIIVNDSSLVDLKSIKRRLRKWLNTEYYYLAREYVYKGSPRFILIENNLINKETSSLTDYKFFCFNGIPRVYYVGTKVFNFDNKITKRREWYTTSGEKIEFNDNEFYLTKSKLLPRHINEMIDLSIKLSTPFRFCRCDFYFVDSKIIFGEITFFHSAGYETFPNLKFEKYLGEFFNVEKAN
jgi:hypothetical protein